MSQYHVFNLDRINWSNDITPNLSTEIDWTALNAKLPTGRDNDSKKKRKAMFRQFDPNGNGVLSLAEVRWYMIFTFCVFEAFTTIHLLESFIIFLGSFMILIYISMHKNGKINIYY